MHERHVAKGHNGNQGSGNHQNGVRQRVPLQSSIRGAGVGGGVGGVGIGDSTPPMNSSLIRDDSVRGLLPAPPLSQGVTRQTTTSRTTSKIIDALSHPAQAAAAAAAVGNQPPRRGRKRKTISLIFLTMFCGAVVYYSGTMYDYDDYFADAKSSRRPRLRSHSPVATAMGMDYQLSTITRMIQPAGTESRYTAQQHLPHEGFASDRHLMIRNRIVNALKAAFVADAASMGTHWIYRANELDLRLNSKEQPEFRSPPVPKFYSSQEFPGHYGEGQPSPYGEQLLFVTNYVADMATSSGTPRRRSEEEFDDDDDNLTPDTILEPMSAAMEKWATTFGGRADHAALEFLSCRRQRVQHGALQQLQAQPPRAENDDDGDSGEDEIQTSCGADDDQAHFFIKVIPMTCLYVGHPHRRHYVEQAIRVHQNNDNAVLLGLALSDLLERVLLMVDDTSSSTATTSDSGSQTGPIPESDAIVRPVESPGSTGGRPVTSLRDALDTSLTLLQEDHSESWFHHFADSFTTRHHQQEALLESWMKAKKTAEKKKSIAQVASASGSSCHMPGALIVSLHALYRAANAEAKTPSAAAADSSGKPNNNKKKLSAATHHNMGYDYLVKTLLGIAAATPPSEPREENPLLVAAVRGNILAAGDTCSRAILMGAILGAAYGGPPRAWWEKLHPVLSSQVEDAAYNIADHAVRRMSQRRRH